MIKMKLLIKYLSISFLLASCCLLFVLSNTLWGFHAFIVTSGSMEPSIHTGSLVITQYNPPQSLKLGDIITFMPPIKEREFVTHRIIHIAQQQNLTLFKTKGDSNINQDTWTLAGGAIVGKVTYTIPYVGYLFSFIKSKIGMVLFILLPAVIIGVNEVFAIFKQIKERKEIIHVNEKVAILCLFFCLMLFSFSAKKSYGLLSDTSALTGNSFTVIQTQCTNHDDIKEKDNEDKDEDENEDDDNRGFKEKERH